MWYCILFRPCACDDVGCLRVDSKQCDEGWKIVASTSDESQVVMRHSLQLHDDDGVLMWSLIRCVEEQFAVTTPRVAKTRDTIAIFAAAIVALLMGIK